jgi:hypothetical protein
VRSKVRLIGCGRAHQRSDVVGHRSSTPTALSP